jgi:hypothetical protein
MRGAAPGFPVALIRTGRTVTLTTHYRVIDARLPDGSRKGMVGFSLFPSGDPLLRLTDVRIPFAGEGDSGLSYGHLLLGKAEEHGAASGIYSRARGQRLAQALASGALEGVLSRLLQDANGQLAGARYAPGRHKVSAYMRMFSRELVNLIEDKENRGYLLTGREFRMRLEGNGYRPP